MFGQTNFLAEATARQIVQRAMGIISHSVNVMDSNGVIIASGNPSRLFQRHEGAVLALTENRVVEIDNVTAEHLKGVRPGINLPFSFRNQRVGVIGISGEPTEVRAYAELVKMAAELMVEQAALLDQNQWEKRYREELANQLLQPQANTASLEAMAAYLGLELQQPRIVWIVELQESQPQRLRELLTELETAQREALIAITGFDEMILLRPACMAQGAWSPKLERQQAQALQSRLKQRFRVRLIVGGFFAGEQGACRSNLTARATQALAQRLKLRHATPRCFIMTTRCRRCCAIWVKTGVRRSWVAPGRSWARRMKKGCCAPPCGTIFRKIVITRRLPRSCISTSIPCATGCSGSKRLPD
ncbi:Sugar diacid regulator [Serratia ficaria]|nr:Sugar diacid regulator [Serratia ficaria]